METAGKGKIAVPDAPAEFVNSIRCYQKPYWHEHVAGRAVVYFLRGRLRFNDGDQSAPFPSALAVWGARSETLASLVAALPGAWRAG